MTMFKVVKLDGSIEFWNERIIQSIKEVKEGAEITHFNDRKVIVQSIENCNKINVVKQKQLFKVIEKLNGTKISEYEVKAYDEQDALHQFKKDESETAIDIANVFLGSKLEKNEIGTVVNSLRNLLNGVVEYEVLVI